MGYLSGLLGQRDKKRVEITGYLVVMPLSHPRCHDVIILQSSINLHRLQPQNHDISIIGIGPLIKFMS
jgi:hypothetical protein